VATPAAFTLISTCVPGGCGLGSTSFQGALNSATWKLFIVTLRRKFLALVPTLPRLSVETNAARIGYYIKDDGRRRAGSQLAKLRHFIGAAPSARGQRVRNRQPEGEIGDGGSPTATLCRPHVRIGHQDRLDQQRGMGMRGCANNCLMDRPRTAGRDTSPPPGR
jgi:hypothetical protein